MSNRYSTVPDETKKSCAEMYLSGCSIAYCSKHYNIHNSTLYLWLKQQNITIRGPSTANTISTFGKAESDRRLKLNPDDLINEYKKGVSLKGVAETFCVTVKFVRKKFKENNFKTRSVADANRIKFSSSKLERKSLLFKLYGEPNAPI